MKEYVVGYDIREMYTSISSWDEQRQRSFLLKEDVTKVLSVYEPIWDSLFRIYRRDLRTTSYNSLYGLPLDLDEILQLAHATKGIKGPFKVIAITQSLDPVTADEKGLLYLPVNPKQLDNRWSLLGYDIANEVRLSGLSSFGYDHYNIDLLKSYFGSRLNINHLFDHYDAALEFQCWNDVRDRAHGPFYIHGIYAIQDLDFGL